MRSDEEVVRDLLARAAETIEVGPGRLVEDAPVRRVRKWSVVVLAAAAVVVVVLAAVTVGATRRSSDASLTDPAPTPYSSAYRLPSFFGFDLATVRRVLERRGVHVRAYSDLVGTCSPLMIVGSDPAVGTALHRGDSVTLTTRGSDSSACPFAQPVGPGALQLLQFVLGTGTGTGTLNWARSVSISVNGTEVLTLSDAQAADPDNWGDALSGFKHAARQVRQTADTTQLPTLEGGQTGLPDERDLPASLCGIAWPHQSIYESVRASVGFHGVPDCQRQQIEVFLEDGSYGFNRVEIYDPTRVGAPGAR